MGFSRGPPRRPASFYPWPQPVKAPSKARAWAARGRPASKMAAAGASVTGRVTWAPPLVRSPRLGRRLSLPGPRPKAATFPVNRSLSDHGNGLGRRARNDGGGGGGLVAARARGAAAAAAAAPALIVMEPIGDSDRELAARWEADAAAVKALAAAELGSVDAGAAGEPERPARDEPPEADASALAQPRAAAEEGDARGPRRSLPTLALAKPRPAPARGPWPHAKPRIRSPMCRRSSGSQRPVTVDSSKAKTSLEALKISLRQLRWKEGGRSCRFVTVPRLTDCPVCGTRIR